MKTIRIEAMSLQNFKGIRNLDIQFPGQETTIAGANGTGKSTIFDAFTWCLFGKDSRDNQKFNVKTLDTQGNTIPQIGHEVSITLAIDGIQHIYTRQLEEQWVKGHGKTETELKGNTTHYFIDGVELKKSEYEEAVSQIIDETLYKNITNPAYFLTQDKDTQRLQLLQMAGTMTDDEIAAAHPELTAIIQAARQAGNKELLQRTLKTRRDKIREELDSCPTQIAAIDSVTPDEPDLENLKKEEADITARMEENEKMLADYRQAIELQSSRRQENLKKQQAFREQLLARQHILEAASLDNYLQETERQRTITSDIAVASNDLARFDREAQSELDAIQAGIPEQKEIDDLKLKKEELLHRWDEEADHEYKADDSGFICPLLKRVCTDPEVMERVREQGQKARAEFYAERDRKLDDIEQQGRALADKIDELLAKQRDGEQRLSDAKVRQIRQRNELAQALSDKKKELEALGQRPERPAVNFAADPQWNEIHEEIERLQEELQQQPENDNSGCNSMLLTQQRELRDKRDNIRKMMAVQDTIEKNEQAKDKIRAREKELAQQLADVEHDMDSLDAYCKIQMTELEERVNAMFEVVRFRMFEKQLNGGEAPACIAMVDGVPYRSDLNTAAKTNAGLDVIRTMQRFYQVSAPIFIDNAEGINQILETGAQTILLKVTRDKKLKVTTPEA